MTRTFSTITWGIALMVGAAVLAWQQSLPWTIAAVGAVPTVAGLVRLMLDDDAAMKAKAAERRAKRAVN